MRTLYLSLAVLVPAVAAAQDEVPKIPRTPAAVTEVVHVQPFRLAQGYRNDWSQKKEVISSGSLVVLKVDPALVYPRNAAEPVLYAGDRTVQRLNHGHQSGHVIGIVPGEMDLAGTLIWFGQPGLPERVTERTIRAERAMAEEAKLQPVSAEAVKRVQQEPVEAAHLSDLLRDHVAELVLKYSPEEKSLVETWRLPVAGRQPKQR
ncbi:hypothetical protein [Maioricimonas sp. JC845]|uniref:hypothetical protein n=1 Tax=Maioricimonas sp. JC845 TaxID=3232138 RepID=UPI00345B021E